MQQLLLPPQMPAHPSIGFGTFYQTSRHAGGDYYDVLPLHGDRIGILVADVSGHGAPAAIVMAMIRAVIHSYPGFADDPPAVLHYINHHFRFLWDTTSMYATAIYAVVDTVRGTMRLSSAGHPLPLRVGPSGNVESPQLDTSMCLLWQEMPGDPVRGSVRCRRAIGGCSSPTASPIASPRMRRCSISSGCRRRWRSIAIESPPRS